MRYKHDMVVVIMYKCNLVRVVTELHHRKCYARHVVYVYRVLYVYFIR